MGRLDDRKSLMLKVLVGARKLIGLAFVLEGVVSLLVYEFGGGQSIWGIDGYSLPNWQVDLKFTLMFWPIGVPICLAIFCLALGGFWSVLLGRAWLIWALRAISVPLGCYVAWGITNELQTGNPFDYRGAFVMSAFVLSPWVIPIRRRKPLSPFEGPAPNVGGE
jgi:hypothetical protein